MQSCRTIAFTGTCWNAHGTAVRNGCCSSCSTPAPPMRRKTIPPSRDAWDSPHGGASAAWSWVTCSRYAHRTQESCSSTLIHWAQIMITTCSGWPKSARQLWQPGGSSAKVFPPFGERQTFVKDLLQGRMQCLATTRDGYPTHPMARGRHRVPDDTTPRPFH